MLLLALESSSLKEKAVHSLDKMEQSLKPIVKELEKKVFHCRADAEKEVLQFRKRCKLKLFECSFKIEMKTTEKWPGGRRNANTKPKLLEEYLIDVTEIRQKTEDCKRYLQGERGGVFVKTQGKRGKQVTVWPHQNNLVCELRKMFGLRWPQSQRERCA